MFSIVPPSKIKTKLELPALSIVIFFILCQSPFILPLSTFIPVTAIVVAIIVIPLLFTNIVLHDIVKYPSLKKQV